MKKLVVASDSFKGSISSSRICELWRENISSDIDVKCFPVADGGEGTVDCFITAVGAERVTIDVTGPYGEPVHASYARLGSTAIIEMAATCGLPLVGDRLDPSKTSTYGTGELISHALAHCATKILLGLGGSATNDGGCGIASALGVKFYNLNGEEFVPVGGTLSQISKVSLTYAKKMDLTLICDVKNPTYGKNGAAFVFAPQKGADEEMVEMLDLGLQNLCKVIKQDLDLSVDTLQGGGAAGGTGAGLYAFFDGKIVSGIDAILDATSFDDSLKDADLCITGEGKLDSQSINGKVLSGISKRCQENDIPLVAVVGIAEDEEFIKKELKLLEIIKTNALSLPFEVAVKTAEADYIEAIKKVLNKFER